jgi:flagellar biosynthetic protein FliP
MALSTTPNRNVNPELGSRLTATGPLEEQVLLPSAEPHRGPAGGGGASLAGARRFFRHFGEMFLAMMVGMMVFGGVDSGILSAAGTSVRNLKDSAPEAFALVMALNMTIGMTLWMRYRSHSWAMCGEMAGAMFLPALAALVLFWCSVIHTRAVGGVEMAAMIPAMLAVMLFRRSEYSQPVRSHPGRRWGKADARARSRSGWKPHVWGTPR